MWTTLRILPTALLAVLLLAAPPAATAQDRQPVLLDTDLGSDIDDAFTLALILASPELDLRGVTTVGSDPQVRALMACRFLTMTGRRHAQVAAGAAPQPARALSPTGQYRYYYHPDVLFNRTTRPIKESAVAFLYSRLKAQPGKVTILAAGPLTNVARLLTEKPDCKPWLRRIVISATDANVRADAAAVRTVLSSGVPLLVVPHTSTCGLKLDDAALRRVFAPGTALTLQVQALYQLWDQQHPEIASALAAALCIEDRFCTPHEAHLYVDAKGVLEMGKGKANARLARPVRHDEFLRWYVERMASCVAPSRRPAKVMPTGPMPHRVHVAEDFDTDRERFWWMSGKAETRNLPPESQRACRGTLTHDFDDLLGHTRAMYTAVIFNPVPGPPMGKHTRLAFRYYLKGAGTLRVQIYSLTNGYHRQLVLTDLPQGRWESAAVDMTQARRPDGTGGPLSENERIDDIQFYADPAAELLIDDIVLYDAASDGEQRPFPKRVLFAAGFDTGQQGKHWRGSFEIVPEKGYFWRAARSVANADRGVPWIRLQLRGARTLGEKTHLSFRYRLSGADSLKVVVPDREEMVAGTAELKNLARDQWATVMVDLTAAGRGKLGRGARIEEIRFVVPRGAELLLDDVLLYEPGRPDE